MLQQDGAQRALATRVLRPVGLARQFHEALLPRIRQGLGGLWRIEPEWSLSAMGLDLPGQLVRDHPALLDLAPHAGRYLQLLCKPGRQAERLRPVGRMLRNELTEQKQDVVAADSWKRHAW